MDIEQFPVDQSEQVTQIKQTIKRYLLNLPQFLGYKQILDGEIELLDLSEFETGLVVFGFTTRDSAGKRISGKYVAAFDERTNEISNIISHKEYTKMKSRRNFMWRFAGGTAGMLIANDPVLSKLPLQEVEHEEEIRISRPEIYKADYNLTEIFHRGFRIGKIPFGATAEESVAEFLQLVPTQEEAINLMKDNNFSSRWQLQIGRGFEKQDIDRLQLVFRQVLEEILSLGTGFGINAYGKILTDDNREQMVIRGKAYRDNYSYMNLMLDLILWMTNEDFRQDMGTLLGEHYTLMTRVLSAGSGFEVADRDLQIDVIESRDIQVLATEDFHIAMDESSRVWGQIREPLSPAAKNDVMSILSSDYALGWGNRMGVLRSSIMEGREDEPELANQIFDEITGAVNSAEDLQGFSSNPIWDFIMSEGLITRQELINVIQTFGEDLKGKTEFTRLGELLSVPDLISALKISRKDILVESLRSQPIPGEVLNALFPDGEIVMSDELLQAWAVCQFFSQGNLQEVIFFALSGKVDSAGQHNKSFARMILNSVLNSRWGLLGAPSWIQDYLRNKIGDTFTLQDEGELDTNFQIFCRTLLGKIFTDISWETSYPSFGTLTAASRNFIETAVNAPERVPFVVESSGVMQKYLDIFGPASNVVRRVILDLNGTGGSMDHLGQLTLGVRNFLRNKPLILRHEIEHGYDLEDTASRIIENKNMHPEDMRLCNYLIAALHGNLKKDGIYEDIYLIREGFYDAYPLLSDSLLISRGMEDMAEYLEYTAGSPITGREQKEVIMWAESVRNRVLSGEDVKLTLGQRNLIQRVAWINYAEIRHRYLGSAMPYLEGKYVPTTPALDAWGSLPSDHVYVVSSVIARLYGMAMKGTLKSLSSSDINYIVSEDDLNNLYLFISQKEREVAETEFSPCAMEDFALFLLMRYQRIPEGHQPEPVLPEDEEALSLERNKFYKLSLSSKEAYIRELTDVLRRACTEDEAQRILLVAGFIS